VTDICVLLVEIVLEGLLSLSDGGGFCDGSLHVLTAGRDGDTDLDVPLMHEMRVD
jgi:hypothetical protein